MRFYPRPGAALATAVLVSVTAVVPALARPDPAHVLLAASSDTVQCPQTKTDPKETPPGQAGIQVRKIHSSGMDRWYRVHLPDGYDGTTPTPVVLAFHGRLKCAQYMENLTGFNSKPVIAVYPEGSWEKKKDQQSWQGAYYSSGADDLQFVRDLLDQLQRDLAVDDRRIFVAGKSNGGGFAALLGCTMPDRIAATGIMSGAFYPESMRCGTARPTPMIDLHGDADTNKPFDRGDQTGDPATSTPGILEWLTIWRRRTTCEASYTKGVNVPVKGVIQRLWVNCSDNDDMAAYQIQDLGHDWASTTPNDDTADPSVVNATDLMWEFFEAHAKPAL